MKFLGLASDDELREAYIKADLFCMPGTAELQSLVTLEAMSASTPVLLADAMALPHLVRDGENGYLFTPNDSDDLAKKITQVLELPKDEQQAMGRASRQLVEPHSIQGTLQTFEDLYRGAVHEHRPESAIERRLSPDTQPVSFGAGHLGGAAGGHLARGGLGVGGRERQGHSTGWVGGTQRPQRRHHEHHAKSKPPDAPSSFQTSLPPRPVWQRV